MSGADRAEAVVGGCHCGAVRFEARLIDGLADPRRCNCSICSMHGAVAVNARHDDLRVTAGEATLTRYRFNSGVAEHFFCSTCGIYTHHRRRSHPDEVSINAACIDGVGPFDFAAVPVGDGVNHVRDRGTRAPDIGVLRFEPAGAAPPRDAAET